MKIWDVTYSCRILLFGVSEVHHFIHELVDEGHEVVSNRFFLQFLEVLDQDLNETVQEEDDFGSI